MNSTGAQATDAHGVAPQVGGGEERTTGGSPDGEATRPPLAVADALRAVAGLTQAQRSVLTCLGAAGEPQTAAAVAAELGIRPSSVRETLDVLLETGLVRRGRMPVTGPGRPSFGYESVAPTRIDEPLGMFLDIMAGTASVLRTTHPAPAQAAREIGVQWADRVLGQAVPDHSRHDDAAYAHLSLSDHMDKIAFFFSALGFAASVEDDRRTITCRSCPFMRGGQVDGLVCEMHRGMSGRVIEATSRGRAAAELRPWATAAGCEVVVTEVSPTS